MLSNFVLIEHLIMTCFVDWFKRLKKHFSYKISLIFQFQEHICMLFYVLSFSVFLKKFSSLSLISFLSESPDWELKFYFFMSLYQNQKCISLCKLRLKNLQLQRKKGFHNFAITWFPLIRYRTFNIYFVCNSLHYSQNSPGLFQKCFELTCFFFFRNMLYIWKIRFLAWIRWSVYRLK